ncbi:hypothetical protein E4634_14220 [Mangrovimicrobium sediminis]|uniref:ApeI dehydratase-like domain-containing protein n=1 Tax=Mangrovimicrobium sediminis TaxID=2562682 RepID=A0A4Z0LZ63_9GAMM|nr:hypothetical protein [Haliea sp. SAOS-164]TGD72673.1 hypothetical protein E4634_14220 [Haliea sp. SAOS-164]
MSAAQHSRALSLPGDPAQWPQVAGVREGDGQFALELQVPESLCWFAGHFPGTPVLPGVVQVFWAECFARQLFGRFPDEYLLRNLKFNQMVLPGAALTLTLAEDVQKGRLEFRYTQADDAVSSGAFTESGA